MYVICAGMARSGSTLQYNITSEILSRSGRGKASGLMGDAEIRPQLAESRELYVIKHHYLDDGVKTVLSLAPAKVIYSRRDLRDVFVSDRKISGSMRSPRQIRQFTETLMDSDLAWRSLPDIYMSRYEDFVDDIEGEVRGIAAYLSVPLSPHDVGEVAEKFSIENQRKRIGKFSEETLEDSGYGPYDKSTQLHKGHIQSARPGRYLTELGAVERAHIEFVASNWLQANGYPLSSPSDGWCGAGAQYLTRVLTMAARLRNAVRGSSPADVA